MPWHMAAMDFLSASLVYCIIFCYMFDFDHMDTDSSAYLAAKHYTYTLTGLYKSEVFQKIGWLITYRIVKAGRHNKYPIKSSNPTSANRQSLFSLLTGHFTSLKQFKPKADPPSGFSGPASRRCEGQASSIPSAGGQPGLCHVSHHVLSSSHMAAGTPGAAGTRWQSKIVPHGDKSSRPGLRQPQELPVKGAW